MSAQISNQNLSTTSNAISAAITSVPPSSTDHPRRRRIVQNYSLIWIDDRVDETNEDWKNTMEHLQNVVNHIDIFTNVDECVDFLTDLEDAKTFLITNDTIGQQLISLIHDIPQLDKVYVFSPNKSLHNEWIKEWTKVKGIYTAITPICAALQVNIKECNQNSVTVNFVPVNEYGSSPNLDQLDPSFMYTQIFKEILLEIKHDEKSIRDFTSFCRSGDYGSSKNIELFEKEYYNKSPIWWYTWPAFIYPMLNYALRTLKTDIIIKMGFFICDLHHQIEQLYQKQLSSYDGTPFTLYRGQGLSKLDFEKLVEAKDGLMSFNNFLSTSEDKEVSFDFAQIASIDTNMIGILFVISIDPSVSSTPFASIKNYSGLRAEEEFLFSMHTVFRIGEIESLDNTHRLYKTKLQLTADDDEQLRILTKSIAKEAQGDTGWKRLGNLLCRLNQLDTAEELYNALLEGTSNDRDKIHCYNQLAYIKFLQGDCVGFRRCFSKTIEIEKKMFPTNHSNLTTSDNSIGVRFPAADEYGKWTIFHDKTVEFNEESFSKIQHSLTTSSSNIAEIDDHDMGQSSESLSFYNNALKIVEETFRSDYPDLATSQTDITRDDDRISGSSRVLWSLGKLLEIRQKVLHPNHPDLSNSYFTIASVYDAIEEYSKALSFYEKAMEIMEINLPPNHPDLAALYDKIGKLYENMEEYSKALSFYQKALHVCQKSLPSTHLHLMSAYEKIASIYNIMEEHSKALPFYEKTLQIQQQILPSNHPDLVASYKDIASMHYNVGKYPEALLYYKKALEIMETNLLPNHSHLCALYNCTAAVCYQMKQYSEALTFCEKELEICQKTLPADAPHLANVHNNMTELYFTLGEYSKALSHSKGALNFFKTSLPANHPNIKTIQDSIDLLEQNSQV